jgi:hypothetical protein
MTSSLSSHGLHARPSSIVEPARATASRPDAPTWKGRRAGDEQQLAPPTPLASGAQRRSGRARQPTTRFLLLGCSPERHRSRTFRSDANDSHVLPRARTPTNARWSSSSGCPTVNVGCSGTATIAPDPIPSASLRPCWSPAPASGGVAARSAAHRRAGTLDECCWGADPPRVPPPLLRAVS